MYLHIDDVLLIELAEGDVYEMSISVLTVFGIYCKAIANLSPSGGVESYALAPEESEWRTRINYWEILFGFY